MISICIIGSGNVAQHLITAFAKSNEVEIIQVYSRNPDKKLHNIEKEKITSDLSSLKDADVYLVAVSDNAIHEVTSKLPFTSKLVVHTSGASSLEVLHHTNRKGVFYPLQTFTKNKEIDFISVPICIEVEHENDRALLHKLAKTISNTIYDISSEQRKTLHLAAVFVCNFVNHLYKIGSDICAEHQVPFEILKPLILETAKKIQSLNPADAQTGPAIRNDTSTINKHLAILTNENQKDIYKLLTKSICDHA